MNHIGAVQGAWSEAQTKQVFLLSSRDRIPWTLGIKGWNMAK